MQSAETTSQSFYKADKTCGKPPEPPSNSAPISNELCSEPTNNAERSLHSSGILFLARLAARRDVFPAWKDGNSAQKGASARISALWEFRPLELPSNSNRSFRSRPFPRFLRSLSQRYSPDWKNSTRQSPVPCPNRSDFWHLAPFHWFPRFEFAVQSG